MPRAVQELQVQHATPAAGKSATLLVRIFQMFMLAMAVVLALRPDLPRTIIRAVRDHLEQ